MATGILTPYFLPPFLLPPDLQAFSLLTPELLTPGLQTPGAGPYASYNYKYRVDHNTRSFALTQALTKQILKKERKIP